MTQLPSFLDEPDDTRGAIMKATYDALCEHGYSDLTIQRIGNEFPKSKSLLYHHYDSKDDLLLDFLEFMLAELEGQMPAYRDGSADEHIADIVDRTFAFGSTEKNPHFTQALLELRTQAAHDEAYREYFTRSDRFVRKHVAHTIQSGIEQGVFQEVDPQETAALFQIVFVGTMTQRVTSDDDDVLRAGRAMFDQCLRARLLRPE
ncbi:TetR/AcrR family transcriptional regulator [Natrialba aegyptia]|uniref:TetR family transcriptional regulator n=1 Tax=Natrialba aegyptia DSM 13077 TaxID=1227491 RepID=M0AMZ9_9EURY|nr:TetR/AcrR family transcriptional regulator [Natrialba aegyptia]ELY98763.1 TetR family transcriptional regulator [Natrialba aegyptia DSM 13077]